MSPSPDTNDYLADSRIPAWVRHGIEKIENDNPAIIGRYPYTYAADYLREHSDEFGVPFNLIDSRSDVLAWLTDQLGMSFAETTPEFEATVRALADAHLRQYNMRLPLKV